MEPGQRGDLRKNDAGSYPKADFVPAKLPRRPGLILMDIRLSNGIDLNKSGSSNHGRRDSTGALEALDELRSTALRPSSDSTK